MWQKFWGKNLKIYYESSPLPWHGKFKKPETKVLDDI